MIQRCTNPNNKDFYRFGGSGIGFDERWEKFENFLEDMGMAPDGTTLDLIDDKRGYVKENCFWATRQEQASNRRSRAKKPKFSGRFHGVHRSGNKWVASFRDSCFGEFDTAEEAARMYDRAMRKYYPEYTRLDSWWTPFHLNFLDEKE